MKKVMATAIVFSLFVANLLFVSANAQPPLPTIYIRPDGSINPTTAPIRRDGDVYTFTGDAFARISIQRSNIILDGAGYTLRGPYNGTVTDIWIIGQGSNQAVNETTVPWVIGVDQGSPDINGLVIRNLNVKNFSIGMYIWTENNTVTGNAVSENIVGILLSGANNTLTKNYIDNNKMGIFFGVNQPGNEPLNIILIHNSFIDNDAHFSGCFCEGGYNTNETIHAWDDGKEGNFWSDYNGTDIDGDGVGDAPYMIDVQNQDRYPLMHIVASPPDAPQKVPAEAVITAIVLSIIIAASVIAYRRRTKKLKSQT